MKENEVGSKKVQLKIFNLQDRELQGENLLKAMRCIRQMCICMPEPDE